ncbi:hypothetical protein CAPTEDRAFT_153870 [Capitella teleta]|uniref:Hexosyltransferase n=1 Tax=Capitella teleta TaxID=283909 RepID=R7VBG0_CAPTE|nr:hypothetical protein CAPTEDRAFT_153870 [Capitella teleta]|eukprot:ELU15892.1 hypothetical protein CAPTEDRAFT_153870 [Capitella teleta]
MASPKSVPLPTHLLLLLCMRMRKCLGLLVVVAILGAILLSLAKEPLVINPQPALILRPTLKPVPSTTSVRPRDLIKYPDFLSQNDLELVSDDVIVENNDESQGIEECDDECTSLLFHFKKWPPTKPTGAIYYLTQKSRLELLKKSLRHLDDNFNDHYQYPVIIFHERELFAHRNKIRGFTRSVVYFQEITMERPDFLKKDIKFHIPCLSTISYRKMCRFHAKGVYESPIVQSLDFLFRLDDDSVITAPIRYDVFAFMRDRRLKYGYIWEHYDAMSCTTGLWEATSHFINVSKTTPGFFNEWRRPKLYYNNFEISHTSVWLSPGYKSYINYLDRLGGMFYHRWGDAPIKGLAVSMFLNRNQTHLFSDIGYTHNTFTN